MAPPAAAEAAPLAKDVIALCRAVVDAHEGEAPPQGLARARALQQLFGKAEANLDDAHFEQALQCGMELLAAAAAQFKEPVPQASRDKAIRSATQALRLFQQAGDPDGEAQAVLALARLQLVRSRPEAAIKWATEAAAGFRKSGNRRGEAAASNAIVDAHVLKAALVGTSKALRQSHQLKMTPSELQEEQKRQRATHFNDAVHAAREAADLFTAAKDKRGKADLFCTLADVRLALGDLDDSKEAAMMARDLYHDLEDPRGEQTALLLEMDAHIADKDGPEALDVGKEIVKVFRKAKDTRGEAEGMLMVMRIHSMMGQMEEMMAVASETRALCKSAGDVKMEGLVVDALMQAHIANEKFDDAVRSAQDALDVYRGARDRQGEAMALHAFGCLELDRFFKEVDKNVAHFKKMGCLQQYWKDLDMPMYNEAIGKIERAVELFKEVGDQQGRRMAEETLENTQKQAAMLNEPDETKQVFKNGRVVDVIKTWRPHSFGDAGASPALADRP